MVKIFVKIIFILVIVSNLTSCSPPAPPRIKPKEILDQAKLSGIWKPNYSSAIIFDENSQKFVKAYDWSEQLILNPDGTYQQIFNNGKGYSYQSKTNKWSVIIESDHTTKIKFENMRYYPDGIKYAEDHEGNLILQVEEGANNPFGINSFYMFCFDDIDLGICFDRE